MPPASKAPVFGRGLEDAFKDNHGACPKIFVASLKLLEEGLDTPDLFRRTADRKKVQLLQRAWEQGRNPLKLAKIHDFAAVSDCLLNWLLSLPSPVIPCKLYHAFLRVHERCSHSQWVHQIRLLLDKLNHQESEVGVPLLAFLHEYDKHQRCKDFRAPSLGPLFGPVLLKAHTQALPMPYPEEVKAVAALVDCLITDYDLIFRPSPSSTSSPVKKPPTRAKFFSPMRKPLMPLGQSSNEQQQCDMRQIFSARMVPLQAPSLMKLRVNVPQSLPQDENKSPNLPHNSGSWTEQSRSSTQSTQGNGLSTLHCEFGVSFEEDKDLDSVVGDLLCGSLNGMLFESDDQRFLDRTSLASSTTTPTSSCQHSEGGTDLSCDEDFAHFAP